MPTPDDIAVSLELQFLVDRGLAARRSGRRDVADVYGRAAQGLIEAALPDVASEVSKIASRKGSGPDVAGDLATRLTPASAAAIVMTWILRDARKPAIRTLSDAFRDDDTFDATFRLLGRRFVV